MFDVTDFASPISLCPSGSARNLAKETSYIGSSRVKCRRQELASGAADRFTDVSSANLATFVSLSRGCLTQLALFTGNSSSSCVQTKGPQKCSQTLARKIVNKPYHVQRKTKEKIRRWLRGVSREAWLLVVAFQGRRVVVGGGEGAGASGAGELARAGSPCNSTLCPPSMVIVGLQWSDCLYFHPEYRGTPRHM